MNPYVYNGSLQHTGIPDLLQFQVKDETAFLTAASPLHK